MEQGFGFQFIVAVRPLVILGRLQRFDKRLEDILQLVVALPRCMPPDQLIWETDASCLLS